MSTPVEKPMRYWEVTYFFRHGPHQGEQMGPIWGPFKWKIRPTRWANQVFSQEDYYYTIEEIEEPEEEKYA